MDTLAMTILMTFIGVLAFVVVFVFTKFNFKKALTAFFAFVVVGILVDVFLASYATMLINLSL